MIRLASLLHRDAEPDLPECRVADGYVFGEPADFPCREAAKWRVAFHCPGCGPRLRLTCGHHRRALAQDPHATCEHCLADGRTVHPIFMWSTSLDAPLNPAYANEETS